MPEPRPPVRVSFVTPHAVLGGAEAVLRTLLLARAPDGVAGVVALQDGPFVDQLRADGFPVEVVPSGRRAGMLPAAGRLARVLAEQQPEVIHANGLKAAVVCGLSPRRAAPVLWMKHDTTGGVRLTRAVAARCHDVVGVSDAVMVPLQQRRRPQAVIRNGIPDRVVDRARGRSAALAALDPAGDPGTQIVALVGRLAPGKGQQELIAVVPRILAAWPGTRVLLVGAPDPAFPGHAQTVREQIAALGLACHVTLTGPREDVPELLSGCEVVAAPSVLDPGGWREGFGLAVAEAMQAATPVVAYASGALPDTVGDGGVVVPEGDREALAGALIELLGHPTRRAELGAAGAARVAACFRPADALAAIELRYRALAGRTSPVPV